MGYQTSRRNARIGALALLFVVCTFGISVSAQSWRYRGGRGITVFTNPNFSGESATFRDDTPDLRGYGLNDKASSLEVPDGETWEVCQDINYGNRCQVFSGSVSDLRSMGWNDRISSVRRVESGWRSRRSGSVLPSRGSQSLLFYDRTGFRGSSTLVTSAASDLSFVGRAASVDVRGGSWELCDRSGRCTIITQSVSDLSQLGLRGRLRSARLVDDRASGSRRNQGGNRGAPWRP